MEMKGQVAVTSSSGQTAASLVTSVLMGNGVSVSNVRFNNQTGVLNSSTGAQLGTFTNNLGVFPGLGFSSGLIVTTGNINIAPGPNNSGSAGNSVSSGMSCPELANLVGGSIYNPAVLEFDFVTIASVVTFNYVFASEEYPEYVGSSYNDVFGFFVTDLVTHQTYNIAHVPGTTIPVAINNVNQNSYSAYYHPVANNSYDMQYDAYIGPFSATMSVVPCRNYHIKIAITNVGDGAFDSAVFLEAQSFSGNVVELDVEYDNPDVPYIIYGCNNGTFTVELDHPLDQDSTFHLTFDGTAVNGVDIQQIPSDITIHAGDSAISFPIIPLANPSSDTLTFTISYTSTNCTSTESGEITIHILHYDSDTILNETYCYGYHYQEHGLDMMLYQDTMLTSQLQNVWGCDSNVYINLHVFPIDPITIPVTICQGDFYLQNDFQIIGQEVGYHTYTHNGISVGGCDSTTILQVTVKPLPEPYLADLKIACTPNDFPILLNPGDFAGYQWNTGETSQILSASEPGYYEVTVASDDGCTATSATTIELHDVSAKITQGVEFCEDLVTTLYVETLAPNVEWNTGETTPEITVHQHGRYSVTASNEYCETMTAITIEECPFNLFVPNTITPWLEDGKNDLFYLSGDLDYIQEMEICIYDRWGKLAYRSTDKNFRWDGKVDGRWLPNNTFTYKLQIVTILSKKYVYKGHINVL